MKKIFLFLGMFLCVNLYAQSNLQLLKENDISSSFLAQKTASYSFSLNSISTFKPLKLVLRGTDYDYDNDGDFTDFAISINGTKLVDVKSLTIYGLGKNGTYGEASFDISEYVKLGNNTIQLTNTEDSKQLDYVYLSWMKIGGHRNSNFCNNQNTTTSDYLSLNSQKPLYQKFGALASKTFSFSLSEKNEETKEILALTGYDVDYDMDGDFTEATILINGTPLFQQTQIKTKGLGINGVPEKMELDISDYTKIGNNTIKITNTENRGQVDYFFLTAILIKQNLPIKKRSEFITIDNLSTINTKFTAQTRVQLNFYVNSLADYRSMMLNIYGTDVDEDNDGDYTDFALKVNNKSILDATPLADIGFGRNGVYDYHSFDISSYIQAGKNTIMLTNTENSDQADYVFIKSVELKGETEINEAPVITITNPNLSRGFKIFAQNILKIEGMAVDYDGILSVRINNSPAKVLDNGYFEAEIAVTQGQNLINVVAQDKKNRIATKSFYLTIDKQGGPVNNQNSQSQLNEVGKFYAIIIGVSDYDDPKIPDLAGEPTKDAQLLYNTLTQKYTFSPNNVKLLKNPTYRQIIRSFDDFSKKVGTNDNLIIFYAGHGDYDQKTNIGYWLPSDAEVGYTDAWLYNSVLVDNIKKINSKHTLLLADACFSGSIFQSRSLMRNASKAIKQKYELKSRSAITSGTLKTVPNKSVFFHYLYNRLQANEKHYFSASELFQKIEIPIANNSPNIPQFGDIKYAGDEGGDFIFIKQ